MGNGGSTHKVSHFLPIRVSYSMEKMAKIYLLSRIARNNHLRQGSSIFVMNWVSLSKTLENKLHRSQTTHSQADGQSKKEYSDIRKYAESMCIRF